MHKDVFEEMSLCGLKSPSVCMCKRNEVLGKDLHILKVCPMVLCSMQHKVCWRQRYPQSWRAESGLLSKHAVR